MPQTEPRSTRIVRDLARCLVASWALAAVGVAGAAAQSTDGQCFCDASGTIAVAQLIRAVNVALGKAECPTGEPGPTLARTITRTPTKTPTPTPTRTSTPEALVDLGESIVDSRTNLEWAKLDGHEDLSDLFTWSASSEDPDGTVYTEYLRHLNETTYAGHRDWRLPTSAGSASFPTGEAAEVEELIRCEEVPCLLTALGSVPFDAYWSASSFASEPTSAWIAVVQTGALAADGKTNLHGARAVRDFVRDCGAETPDGTTCDAGRDGVVRTCVDGACQACTAEADAEPRFVDNHDGTVTDRSTCLVWEQKTGSVDQFVTCAQPGDCPDHHDVNNRYTWSGSGGNFDGGAATLFLAQLNDPQRCFADHCDWRLPELGDPGVRQGLRSILDCGFGADCIDPLFGPTAAAPYWSATTPEQLPDRALILDFSDGDASAAEKTFYAHVRAVRGTSPGSCVGRPDGVTCDAGVDGAVLTCDGGICSACLPDVAATPRYLDNGDGTIIDLHTCLVWEMKTGTPGTTVLCTEPERCPDPHHVNNAYSWTGGGGGLDGTAKTLFLDLLNDSANDGQSCFAGHCDWRLPAEEGLNPPMTGVTEWQDILLQPFPCGLAINLCLDPLFAPAAGSVYWSATAVADEPARAWAINVLNGGAVGAAKAQRAYVRAVRGGG